MTVTDERGTITALPILPAADIGAAFAEVSRWIERHPAGCPDTGGRDLVVSFRVQGGSRAERIAYVHEFADWLGVPAIWRYGTCFAQRRFGGPGPGVILECHTTPDPDAAHLARTTAPAGDAPEGEGAEAA